MNRHPWLKPVLGLVAVALLVFGISRLFEPYDETVELPPLGEARINPLLALERMLEKKGIATLSLPRLRQLPPPLDHVLVIATGQGASLDGDVQPLLDWVSEGGHLVVTPAPRLYEDELLYELGIETFDPSEWDDEADEEHWAEGNDVEDEWIEDEQVEDDQVEEDLVEEDLVEEDRSAVLVESRFASTRPDTPLLYVSDDTEVLDADGSPRDGAYSITVRFGDGSATVLSGRGFLLNDAIGERDHALIAWRAIDRQTNPLEGVWLIFQQPRPSIFTLFTAKAAPLVISLAALLIATLWFHARRFGPRVEPPSSNRRHLSEHVRAAGRFLWRHGEDDVLIQAERRALHRQLGHGEHPGGDALIELAERQAHAAGLDVDAVREAVELPTTRDPRQLTRTIRLLEALRRSS